MKLYVQQATARGLDWRAIDSADWNRLPLRPAPVGGEVLDDTGGWINAGAIMGTEFTGYDHLAVRDMAGGKCRITAWKDDPEDIPPEEFFARQLTLWPLREDPNLGGAINTYGETVLYCAPAVHARFKALGPIQNTVLKTWAEFRKPGNARHGIWTPDALHRQLEGVRTPRRWREWTDGVHPSRLKNGIVAPQRSLGFYNRPFGTKTYYQRDTDLATGIHATDDATLENLLDTAAGAGETETDIIAGGASVFLYCFTTAVGQPNSAAWPTGDYRCQFDASIVGADVTFGLRTAGAVTGHFARVNTGLTSDLETKAQTEALFAEPAGLKLATTGSVSWAAGAASDRFECLVAATRAANHGNQELELTYDSDAFADGPWVAAASIAPQAMHHYKQMANN